MGGSVVNVDFEQYGTDTKSETQAVTEAVETAATAPNATTEAETTTVENTETQWEWVWITERTSGRAA